jgi:hypothetical protein
MTIAIYILAGIGLCAVVAVLALLGFFVYMGHLDAKVEERMEELGLHD